MKSTSFFIFIILLTTTIESFGQQWGFAWAENSSDVYVSQLVDANSFECPDLSEIKKKLSSQYPQSSQTEIDGWAKGECLSLWLKKHLIAQGINVQSLRFRPQISSDKSWRERMIGNGRNLKYLVNEVNIPTTSSGKADSQSDKYAFVVFNMNSGKLYTYIGPINLNKIQCISGSVETSEQCLRIYVEKIIERYPRFKQAKAAYYVLNSKNGYNAGCVYKNEKVCYFSLEEARSEMNKSQSSDKARGWFVIEIPEESFN